MNTVVDRGLHVVVDAARAGALEEGEGAVVRVEHHLLGLARIGPHEQHPAVAQPDMRHLDGHRRAVDQHDLVRPVELVGLARRKAQRHIGFRGRRPAFDAPLLGIAADRVVAALIAEAAQLLEDPDQGQPLARRLALVRQQQTVELTAPRADSRQRLLAALIAKLGRPRPDHLAHDLPRHPKLAANRLDRLLLGEMRPTDLRDRLHYQHPQPGPHVPHGSHCGPARPRGPDWMPITPKTGSLFHA